MTITRINAHSTLPLPATVIPLTRHDEQGTPPRCSTEIIARTPADSTLPTSNLETLKATAMELLKGDTLSQMNEAIVQCLIEGDTRKQIISKLTGKKKNIDASITRLTQRYWVVADLLKQNEEKASLKNCGSVKELLDSGMLPPRQKHIMQRATEGYIRSQIVKESDSPEGTRRLITRLTQRYSVVADLLKQNEEKAHPKKFGSAKELLNSGTLSNHKKHIVQRIIDGAPQSKTITARELGISLASAQSYISQLIEQCPELEDLRKRNKQAPLPWLSRKIISYDSVDKLLNSGTLTLRQKHIVQLATEGYSRSQITKESDSPDATGMTITRLTQRHSVVADLLRQNEEKATSKKFGSAEELLNSSTLNAAQKDIVGRIIKGHTRPQIVREMGVPERTAYDHINQLLDQYPPLAGLLKQNKGTANPIRFSSVEELLDSNGAKLDPNQKKIVECLIGGAYRPSQIAKEVGIHPGIVGGYINRSTDQYPDLAVFLEHRKEKANPENYSSAEEFLASESPLSNEQKDVVRGLIEGHTRHKIISESANKNVTRLRIHRLTQYSVLAGLLQHNENSDGANQSKNQKRNKEVAPKRTPRKIIPYDSVEELLERGALTQIQERIVQRIMLGAYQLSEIAEEIKTPLEAVETYYFDKLTKQCPKLEDLVERNKAAFLKSSEKVIPYDSVEELLKSGTLTPIQEHIVQCIIDRGTYEETLEQQMVRIGNSKKNHDDCVLLITRLIVQCPELKSLLDRNQEEREESSPQEDSFFSQPLGGIVPVEAPEEATLSSHSLAISFAFLDKLLRRNNLTSEEKKVVKLAIDGFTQSQIAEMLGGKKNREDCAQRITESGKKTPELTSLLEWNQKERGKGSSQEGLFFSQSLEEISEWDNLDAQKKQILKLANGRCTIREIVAELKGTEADSSLLAATYKDIIELIKQHPGLAHTLQQNREKRWEILSQEATLPSQSLQELPNSSDEDDWERDEEALSNSSSVDDREIKVEEELPDSFDEGDWEMYEEEFPNSSNVEEHAVIETTQRPVFTANPEALKRKPSPEQNPTKAQRRLTKSQPSFTHYA